MSLGKPAMMLAVLFAASSFAVLPARADMEAKDGKASHEYCGGKKHHDGYGRLSSKEQWKKSLTGGQASEISGLRLSLKKELAAVKAKLGLKEAEIDGLLVSDAPDRAALDKLVGEAADLKKEMMKAKYAHMVKVRSLLAAEQKAMFDTAVLIGEGRRHRH